MDLELSIARKTNPEPIKVGSLIDSDFLMLYIPERLAVQLELNELENVTGDEVLIGTVPMEYMGCINLFSNNGIYRKS